VEEKLEPRWTVIAELDFWLKVALVAAVCVAIFVGSRRD
jgi:hypothetical protein